MDIELPAPEQVLALLPKWRAEHPRLEAMFERYGEPVKALRHMGLLFWQQGDLIAATRMLAGAVSLAPAQAPLWSGLGGVLFASGHRAEAASCIRNALNRDPSQATDWLMLGTIHSGEPDSSVAEEAFLNALQCDPQLPDAVISLGLLYTRTKRYAEAARCLQDAIARGTQSPAVHTCLAQALFNLGDFPGAVRTFAEAVRRQPDDQPLRQKFGQARFLECMLTGTLAEALAAYREAVGSEPEDPEKLARDSFHILSGYGHHEAAIRLGEAQRAQKPDDPIQTYLLAALKQAPIDRAPDDYVITYFDKFAETFDRQLVEVLDYHGPEKLYALVAMHDRPLDHDDFGLNQSKIMNVVDSNNLERDAGEKPVPTFSHPAQTRILDLGCGTGLAGPLLKRPGRVLTGVDLSPRMLEKAAARQAYDHLIASEAVAYLAQQEHGFDLIFAADFLIYVGDLAPLMRHAARLLGPGGLLALTIETTQDYDNFGLNQSKIVNVIDSKNLERDAGGKPLHTFPHPALETYRLLPSGRFAHRPGYIEDLTRGSFILRRQEPTMIRLEANRPVDGALLLFERI